MAEKNQKTSEPGPADKGVEQLETVNGKDTGTSKDVQQQVEEHEAAQAKTAALIADGDFGRYASNAPEADLNIFPLPEKLDADFLWSLRDATGSSCLFTQDSGDESGLA